MKARRVARGVEVADDGRAGEDAGAAQRPAGQAEQDDAAEHEPVLGALVDVEADHAPACRRR